MASCREHRFASRPDDSKRSRTSHACTSTANNRNQRRPREFQSWRRQNSVCVYGGGGKRGANRDRSMAPGFDGGAVAQWSPSATCRNGARAWRGRRNIVTVAARAFTDKLGKEFVGGRVPTDRRAGLWCTRTFFRRSHCGKR